MKTTTTERLTIEIEGEEVKTFRALMDKVAEQDKVVGFAAHRLSEAERKLVDELKTSK